MKKIAIIGAGQVGSRHLQGLARIDIPVRLEVVDTSRDSLQLAKQRLEEMPPNENILSVAFKSSVHELSAELDLCIIATTSQVRLKVLKEVLAHKSIPFLILEKVLFQSVEQLREAERLLKDKTVKSWVNCPRRINEFYKSLKPHLGNSVLQYKVKGVNWGLGSNCIHMIDHLAYYTEDYQYCVDTSELDPVLRKSLRSGFVEFSGTLKAYFSKGSVIELVSSFDGDDFFEISITSEKLKVIVDEISGRATLMSSDKGWDADEVEFRVSYQSELTHMLAKEIFDTGSSSLTSFEESCLLHLPLIEALSKSFESIENRSINYCPIT